MLVVENPFKHVIRPPNCFFKQANILASLRVADKEDTNEDSEADCDIPVITPQKRKRASNKDLSSLPNCPMPTPAYQQPEVIEEVPIGNLHRAQKLSLISASLAIKKASKLLKTSDDCQSAPKSVLDQ
ncbi:hypothetical protein PCASD_20463 [Puccinia coronata f. sp. avenae]|uniref:Uncharacterized protein n=1 Tax=Puccinia coronata f. sp. avenae TaxID=200324 RepID=A0A2N5TVR1_9BASI|nr:hypothetical protein PCASD_20463 [Puccinia coronata f. sp. avenae]